MVSDPTTKSHPVGVDVYRIGERGPQYSPLGVLYPLQDPPGKGLYRCVENITADLAQFANWFNDSCSIGDSNTAHVNHDHLES